MFAAGLTILPHHVLSKSEGSDETRDLSVTDLARYQIVLPDDPNPIEKEAAEKLQQYLSEVSRTRLAVTTENAYKGKPAFLIGQTRYAKRKAVNLKQLNEDGFVLQPADRKC